MAIKEFISLEGVEDVQKALKSLGDAGESALKQFSDLSGQAPSNLLVSIGTSAQSAGDGMSKGADGAKVFTEALHLLHPVMVQSGLEFGNLRSLAAAASEGLPALASVIGGVLVVAFANLEEAAARTDAKLSGLFGSKELGVEAFGALKQNATDLNTTVEALSPAFEAATVAIQRFVQTGSSVKFVALQGIDLPKGIAGNINDTATAVDNLIKIIRASGATEGEAEKAATAFFTALQNGGKLTAEALKQMDPGAVSLLAQALGKGAISAEQFRAEIALAPPNILKVTQGLATFGPQAKQAFDTSAVKSFKDEFQGLANDLSNAFKLISGTTFSQFLIDQLTQIRKGIKDSIDQINSFKNFIKQLDDAANQIPGVKALVDFLNRISNFAAPAATAATEAVKQFGTGNAPPVGFGTGTAPTAFGVSAPTRPVGSEFAGPSTSPADIVKDITTVVTQGAESWMTSIGKFATDTTAAIEKLVTDTNAALNKLFEPPPATFDQRFQGTAPATFNERQGAAPTGQSTLGNIISTISSGLISPAGAAELPPGAVSAGAAGLPKAGDVDNLSQSFNSLATTLGAVSSAVSSLREVIQSVINTTGDLAQSLQQAANVNFSNIASQLQQIASAAQEAASSVQQLASASQQVSSSGGGGFGFSGTPLASGGLVVGPGTGTSDSIMARISAGEFIMNAAATRHWGARFLSALNNMRMPSLMPQSTLIPRFAEGGPVSASRPIHLHLGGEAFAMNASENVASALRKHAVKSRLLSTGRKPSWY